MGCLLINIKPDYPIFNQKFITKLLNLCQFWQPSDPNLAIPIWIAQVGRFFVVA